MASSPEPKPDRSIHLTILGGSVIIAVGLFLGLQSRSPEPSPQPSTPEHPPARGSATVPAPRLPDEGPAPSPPVAVTDELKSTAEKQAAEALEGQHGDLVKRCWEPSIKTNPEPAKAKYIYNVSFGADGKEIARGISDVRGMERPDVGQCLRAQPLTLRIPPPGVVVGNVTLTLTLP